MSLTIALIVFALLLVVPVTALIVTADPETKGRLHRLGVSIGHTLAFDPRHPDIRY